MPTLEIAVDARGVTTGLEQANRALDQTAQKADRAEKEVKQMGQSAHVAGRDMGAAFAATGGGLAVTHGLVGITDGFRRADGAMAAFAASQALLDLGRFAEDMKSVTAATGGTATVMGTLASVMKAHPLLTIATVLAGAASFMGVFARETDEAKDSVDELGKSIRELEAAGATRLFLTGGEQTGASARMAAIEKGLQQLQLQGYRTTITVEELARMTGLPSAEIMRVGQQIGAPGFRYGQATGATQMPTTAGREIARDIYRNLGELLRIERMGVGARFGPSGTGMPRLLGTDAPMGAYDVPLPPGGLGQEALRGGIGMPFGMGFGIQLGMQAAAQMRPRGATAPSFDIFGMGQPGGAFARGGVVYPQGFGTGAALMRQPGMPGTFGYQEPAGAGGIGMPFGMGFGMQAGMQSMALMQQYGREQVEAAKMAMDELIAQGEQFGQTIGDAFFRVAEGTMTARQAMAELVRQFAQLAAQGVFRQIGGAVGGAFAPTQTQNLANVGGVQPGMTGGTPGG